MNKWTMNNEGWLKAWMNEQKEGWIGKWKEVWINEWMNEQQVT